MNVFVAFLHMALHPLMALIGFLNSFLRLNIFETLARTTMQQSTSNRPCHREAMPKPGSLDAKCQEFASAQYMDDCNKKHCMCNSLNCIKNTGAIPKKINPGWKTIIDNENLKTCAMLSYSIVGEYPKAIEDDLPFRLKMQSRRRFNEFRLSPYDINNGRVRNYNHNQCIDAEID